MNKVFFFIMSSVSRFGKNSLLWQNLPSLWQFFMMYSVIGKILNLRREILYAIEQIFILKNYLDIWSHWSWATCSENIILEFLIGGKRGGSWVSNWDRSNNFLQHVCWLDLQPLYPRKIATSVTRLGNFLKPLATINFPKSPTFFVNFCKGVKIYHILVKSFLATFMDIWQLFSGHTDCNEDNIWLQNKFVTKFWPTSVSFNNTIRSEKTVMTPFSLLDILFNS